MKTLENAIIEKYKYTRSKALFLIKNGLISVNDKIILKRSTLISNDDEIFVKIPTFHSKIIWRNENLIIVDKPAGMVVERCQTTSIAHTVLSEEICSQLQLNKVFPIHRLDKDTSGLIMIALNEKALTYYKNLMNERKFTKGYKAFYTNVEYQLSNANFFECIHGKLVWSHDSQCLCDQIINYKLHTIQINEKNHKIKISKNGDKVCHTLMQPIINGYNCILITGRTHQIRLTMKSINKVISGDELYGSKEKCPLQLFSYYIDMNKDFLI